MNLTEAQISYRRIDPFSAWFKTPPLEFPSPKRVAQLRARTERSVGIIQQSRYHKGWSKQHQRKAEQRNIVKLGF